MTFHNKGYRSKNVKTTFFAHLYPIIMLEKQFYKNVAKIK